MQKERGIMVSQTSLGRKFLLCLLALLLTISTTIGSVPLTAYADGTPEEDAAQYIQDQFITNSENKIFSNGGAGITRDTSGLNYTVGLYTINSYGDPTSELVSLRMNTATSVIDTTKYTPAMTVASTTTTGAANDYVTANGNATRGRFSIDKRPTADEGDVTIVFTLALYDTSTSSDDINAGTATPLATQEFNVTITHAARTYNVTFKTVDSADTSVEISGAMVQVNEGDSPYTNKIDPNTDGSYTLTEGKSYLISASADGYNDYSQSGFQPTASTTVTLPMVKKEYRNVTLSAVDKTSGEAVEDAVFTVKQGWYSTVSPESGVYKLEVGKTYTISATADGYKDYSADLAVTSETAETYTAEMEAYVYHTATFNITKSDGTTTIDGATIVLRQGSAYGTVVSAESDGTYKVAEGETYYYTVSKDGYTDVTGNFTVETSDITVPVSMSIETYK
ncbi:MAG: hypothetical protein ACOYIK_11520, partial [Coriobacteriales bacterium]